MRVWLFAGAAPVVLLSIGYGHALGKSWAETGLVALGVAAVWAIAGSWFFDSVIRPLQTLSNIVAALREEDYSFRARGARRGDSLGDLALEINALAGTLQQQRGSALDALALADRVMTSMQSPILAFDGGGRLRLLNAAAEQTFQLRRPTALGRTAETLGLSNLTEVKDESLYTMPTEHQEQGAGAKRRWSVRRAGFRLYGVPHTLFVLSDVAAALQEEERVAWQRLIRVLAHEINNSLTPIKSIATTLRTRTPLFAAELPRGQEDFQRGLAVIEDRAESLNRFLQAYQQISRLPQPQIRPFSVAALMERTVPLERRIAVRVEGTQETTLCADPDQLQQLIINLIKNAAEAVLDTETRIEDPEVAIDWSADLIYLKVQVIDNGVGLANPSNLFVPFYTTKTEGTGIGLTLSQQIAAAHRGSVTLRNRTDRRGCIAEAILPLLGP